jgi:hypothetical protein
MSRWTTAVGDAGFLRETQHFTAPAGRAPPLREKQAGIMDRLVIGGTQTDFCNSIF